MRNIVVKIRMWLRSACSPALRQPGPPLQPRCRPSAASKCNFQSFIPLSSYIQVIAPDISLFVELQHSLHINVNCRFRDKFTFKARLPDFILSNS